MSVDELNKIAVQIKYLEEQIETLQGQMQIIESSILNLESTNLTIENIKTIKEGDEILIPAGTDSFMKGIITDTKKVIMHLGSDIFADTTLDAAKENLNKRIDELKNAQQSLGGRLQQFINQINELKPRFQELYAQLQQQQAGPGPAPS